MNVKTIRKTRNTKKLSKRPIELVYKTKEKSNEENGKEKEVVQEQTSSDNNKWKENKNEENEVLEDVFDDYSDILLTSYTKKELGQFSKRLLEEELDEGFFSA
ncbi:hypothetical protein Tco_0828420 [Tanacetum coccineum]